MIEISNVTIAAARDGDQAACREIVELMHRPIIATIFRFLGPGFRKDIEDIAQDVFLKIFRAIDRFDPERAKFTTWTYTFVRNHCFDVLKKRRLRTSSLHAVRDDESDRDFADDRELLPVHSSENEELGRRIGEALQTLGEDQRMVFILREYEGLDYREIAGVTGVNEGTVKSRLFRAKEALRQQLEPYLKAGA
ncbi:MAG: sigma-70 family RNA polymerase sigma factor [Planctomycetes bacterium]|nr:sigma-70 family RNA polymerase sigma factor [Planctomycetota bacterium]